MRVGVKGMNTCQAGACRAVGQVTLHIFNLNHLHFIIADFMAVSSSMEISFFLRCLGLTSTALQTTRHSSPERLAVDLISPPIVPAPAMLQKFNLQQFQASSRRKLQLLILNPIFIHFLNIQTFPNPQRQVLIVLMQSTIPSFMEKWAIRVCLSTLRNEALPLPSYHLVNHSLSLLQSIQSSSTPVIIISTLNLGANPSSGERPPLPQALAEKPPLATALPKLPSVLHEHHSLMQESICNSCEVRTLERCLPIPYGCHSC